jgi:hypothetical protein
LRFVVFRVEFWLILDHAFDKFQWLIHNLRVMGKSAEKYAEEPDFREFLNREFERTAANATLEELAEFAFGSMDAAIAAFVRHKKG